MKIYHLEAKHPLLPAFDKYVPAYMLKGYAIPLRAAKYDILVKEVIKKVIKKEKSSFFTIRKKEM